MFHNLTKTATTLGGLSLAVGGVISLAIASPAHAETSPYNCNIYIGTDGAGYAKCQNGTVRYRVGMACAYPGFGPFEVYGDWRMPGDGGASTRRCPVLSSPWIAPGNTKSYAWLSVS